MKTVSSSGLSFFIGLAKGLAPVFLNRGAVGFFFYEIILCERLHICHPQARPVIYPCYHSDQNAPHKVMDKFRILIVMVVSVVYTYMKINKLYTLLCVSYNSVQRPENAPFPYSNT